MHALFQEIQLYPGIQTTFFVVQRTEISPPLGGGIVLERALNKILRSKVFLEVIEWEWIAIVLQSPECNV